MASEMYEPAIFMSEQVTYGDFYAWFKAKLAAAGWENITSNYATDGDVWYSTGESGTKNYYFQTFAPESHAGMITKPYLKYTPGVSGSAGVFIGSGVDGGFATYGLALPIHAGNGFDGVFTPPSSSTLFSIRFFINKDRAIVAITLPEGLFTSDASATYSGFYGKSSLWYIGAPELYSTSSTDSASSKGLIVFGTRRNQGNGGFYYQGVSVYSSIGNDPVLKTYDINPIYKLDTSPMFKTRNVTGSFMLLDLVCGGSYEGMLMLLKDLFVVPKTTAGVYVFSGLYDGDLISDGQYTYKVILGQIGGYKIIPLDLTNYYAIRVS
ncbi:hypothetical protein [Anaerospora hongkongensis]|uniref:hypothetical protein n=1 Tax=Anaerospora hongkongensis TaxID=244830 RepID=UPI0028A09C79|nr:hypothetical protein [Anaerospora hongkongensis]